MPSSKKLEFLRYLYLLQRNAYFSVLILKITLLKKAHFMLYSNPLKYLRYILPFKSYECKFLFLFFNSAIPLCEVFLAKTLLLHVENAVKWALVKIHNFCFLLEKAEIYTVNCTSTHRKKNNNSAVNLDEKNVSALKMSSWNGSGDQDYRQQFIQAIKSLKVDRIWTAQQLSWGDLFFKTNADSNSHHWRKKNLMNL